MRLKKERRQTAERREAAKARGDPRVRLLQNKREQLCRRPRDAVECSPIAFLPDLPRDKQHKRVEAMLEGLRNGCSRVLPPL